MFATAFSIRCNELCNSTLALVNIYARTIVSLRDEGLGHNSQQNTNRRCIQTTLVKRSCRKQSFEEARHFITRAVSVLCVCIRKLATGCVINRCVRRTCVTYACDPLLSSVTRSCAVLPVQTSELWNIHFRRLQKCHVRGYRCHIGLLTTSPDCSGYGRRGKRKVFVAAHSADENLPAQSDERQATKKLQSLPVSGL